MSWCDKLASTPTVGFALTPHFAFGSLVDAFAPILDRLVDRFRNPTFVVNETAQSNAWSFTTEDGFYYGVEPRTEVGRYSIYALHLNRAMLVKLRDRAASANEPDRPGAR
jgi:hypothetical protein